MAETDQSSLTSITSPSGSSPAITSAIRESNLIPVTNHKLNGHNYLQWSQSVMMFISGKGRDDYLTGAVAPPDKSDTSYKLWRSENNMVMSWLISSMTTEIGGNFLLYSTARDIWEAARETYSSSENTLNYFRQIVETKRVFKFLMGLNKSLDEVRGRILATKPFPSLREAFSEVRREESQRKVMLGQSGALSTPEGSALVAHGLLPSQEDASIQAHVARGPLQHLNDNKPRRGRPWCDHCRKPGHTKDTC
ncbi:uncharacterized protein LOC112094608 [Morus notabilis]|uniref:uncharacterized protein LOC112094608 n=1 Tax=Morus notabilis TaxID=981085 RepID=UPI000CED6674|nr:uncharacterized protein LOC112094608 [Morus notabilis]